MVPQPAQLTNERHIKINTGIGLGLPSDLAVRTFKSLHEFLKPPEFLESSVRYHIRKLDLHNAIHHVTCPEKYK